MSVAEKYAADKYYGTHRSFKTRLRHRKLRFLTHFNQRRPLGLRARPELVVLEPKEGVAPSGKPPVRIFMGQNHINTARSASSFGRLPRFEIPHGAMRSTS
jgi:hypothetical protein